MKFLLAAFLFCSAMYAWQSAALSGDPDKGDALFTSQGCSDCHAIGGVGGNTGPDLGTRIGGGYTPAQLAGALWNHAPTMWAAMARDNRTPPPLSLHDTGDLFAFFFAERFFEKPGNAVRGQRLFEVKACATCHAPRNVNANAKPVTEWTATGNPMLLAEAMWNHSGPIRTQISQSNLQWPQISAQQLTDIMVYASSRQRATPVLRAFGDGELDHGRQLYESKGCARCHQGKLMLRDRLKGMTLTEVAAAFWNHTPAMASEDPQIIFHQGEMNVLLTWVWAQDFFGAAGSSVRGKNVYQSKHCATCHTAASLTGEFSSIRMTAALWQHGPAMLTRMKEKSLPWPRFRTLEMQDLIAYLNQKQK